MAKIPTRMVVILGPTASGKSSLAIHLARKYQGEIISADSRQVYKGMNIGTGKVTKQEQRLVPHHLLDVASPKKQFNVTDFKRLAEKAVNNITKRGKLPFVVGGTGFYIQALIDDVHFPVAKPNLKLRKALQKKTAKELFVILKNLDPKRAQNIDRNNPVRLIRAIEINVMTGKSVPRIKRQTEPQKNILILGIKKSPAELRRLINKRVDDRLKQGMVNEVRKLRRSGISFKRLESFGLEYRFIAHYLQKILSYDEMVAQLKTAIYRFSKRQMTWFKRDHRIKWVSSPTEATKLVAKFLK